MALALTRILGSCSVARRLSWAATRYTTRVEDVAYSLMGLFGVNMPLLYGEGGRAFFRLQQEIMKTSDDQSILAFTQPVGHGLLADSPQRFANSIIEKTGLASPVWPGGPLPPYELVPSSKVVEIGLCLCPLRDPSGDGERVVA